jgi:carbamoyl-phosphate synthase large subunit
VKPRRGSSSRGVRIIATIHEIGVPPPDEDYIIQPFITGDEVTVDVVVISSAVRSIGARKRLKTRGGEVERGITIDGGQYLEVANRIAQTIGLDRPFNFQVFENDRYGCVVSEVNARLGGGMPLSQYSGAMVLEAVLGRLPDDDVHIARTGMVMTRYDSSFCSFGEELLR